MTEPKSIFPEEKKGDVVDYQKLKQEELDRMKKRIQTAGEFIRCTQDKKFKMPDGQTSTGPIRAVIIDFVAGNFYYDRPFKSDDLIPPACFALGLEPAELVPHPSSPVVQSKTGCKDCEQNKWSSAPQGGKGKACSNTRILALARPDETEGKFMMLRVSPTGVKAFDAYVASLKAQFNKLPIEVVTDIFFDPNLTFGSLRFSSTEGNKNVNQHFGIMKAARERLLVPVDVSNYTAPKGKKGKS